MICRRLFGDNERLGYAPIGQSLRRQLSDFSLAPRELGRRITRTRGLVESGIRGTSGLQHTVRSQRSTGVVFRMPRLFAKCTTNNAQPVLIVRPVRRPDRAAQSRQFRITSAE